MLSSSPFRTLLSRLGVRLGRIDEMRPRRLADERDPFQQLIRTSHQFDREPRDGGMEKIDGNDPDLRKSGLPDLPSERPATECRLVRGILKPPADPLDVPFQEDLRVEH